MLSSFLLAAPASGSGKTTVARGLMALLRRHGLAVQPFKCGPDYIDTKMHTAVCGRSSVNLDSFFASPAHLRWLFNHYSAGADVSVVEGMMGLFDGYDRSSGSCTEIAKILGLPVVLIVDARSAAYTLAPQLLGLREFDPNLHLAGVIFNKVGSPRHERLLAQTAEDAGLTCLGYLPRHAALEQPSRYLGLDFSHMPETKELIHLLETHVDWQALMRLFPSPLRGEKEGENPSSSTEKERSLHFPFENGLGMGQGQCRIAVARNAESFSFIYQETLDAFRQQGEIVFYDPSDDEPLPEDITLLYLPGGYPERHSNRLSACTRSLQSVTQYALRGGHVIAECGGMIYLCKELFTDEGSYPLCGVLPYSISARNQDRHLSLGYRQINTPTLHGKGHEFHYTQFFPKPPSQENTSGGSIHVYDALGQPVCTPILRHYNVWASYAHLYWPLPHDTQ